MPLGGKRDTDDAKKSKTPQEQRAQDETRRRKPAKPGSKLPYLEDFLPSD